MIEDYTRARILASFTSRNVIFRVVRRRLNGKPWRGYLELLGPGDVACAGSQSLAGCPKAAAAVWEGLIEKTFDSNAALVNELRLLTEKQKAPK